MLKRGFKTWCERTSLNYKKELEIGKHDPMKAVALAEHLHIKLLIPQNIPGLSDVDLRILLNEESNAWSAVTLCKGKKHIVIYNPSRSDGRQSNDIMHELSHIIIGHKAQMMHSFETGIFLRHYDKSQEEEADWLAGTLLLNRDALIHIAFSSMEPFIAAKKYGVSEKLLSMRLNITGVKAIQKRKLGLI
jgi:Zn-dependent peptidase ImmA (M78 family)